MTNAVPVVPERREQAREADATAGGTSAPSTADRRPPILSSVPCALDLAGGPDLPAVQHLGQHQGVVVELVPVDDGLDLVGPPRAAGDDLKVPGQLVGGEPPDALLAQHPPPQRRDLPALARPWCWPPAPSTCPSSVSSVHPVPVVADRR